MEAKDRLARSSVVNKIEPLPTAAQHTTQKIPQLPGNTELSRRQMKLTIFFLSLFLLSSEALTLQQLSFKNTMMIKQVSLTSIQKESLSRFQIQVYEACMQIPSGKVRMLRVCRDLLDILSLVSFSLLSIPTLCFRCVMTGWNLQGHC